jgi:hypothetical protein
VVPGSVDAGSIDARNADAGSCVKDPSTPHDEDGDQLDDACDPCPLIPDQASLDRDSDGIPDACDVDVAGAPDRVWLFHGFADQPTWANSPSAGDHDRLRITAPGGDDDESTELVLPLSSAGRVFNSFRVSISISVESLVTSAEVVALGLRVAGGRADDSLFCTIYQDLRPREDPSFGMEDTFGFYDVVGYPWVAGAQYTIALERHDDVYTCQVDGPAGPARRVLTSQVTPATGAAVSITAFAVTATLDWVYVLGP